jgi:hypothetical protein
MTRTHPSGMTLHTSVCVRQRLHIHCLNKLISVERQRVVALQAVNAVIGHGHERLDANAAEHVAPVVAHMDELAARRMDGRPRANHDFSYFVIFKHLEQVISESGSTSQPLQNFPHRVKFGCSPDTQVAWVMQLRRERITIVVTDTRALQTRSTVGCIGRTEPRSDTRSSAADRLPRRRE